MSKRFRLPLILLSLVSLIACIEDPPPTDETEETLLHGRAPLNLGGELLVVAHDDPYPKDERTAGEAGSPPGALYRAHIDDSGRFEVKVWGALGRFTLVAKGGKYIEPANGTIVPHSGETLRAAVHGVKASENAEVAITPWTEMAYAQGGLDGYPESLRTLADTLSCQSAAHTRLLEVAPTAPADGIHSLSSGALSYVYLGAFSQLADDLSRQFGVQTGKRITSMSLAKVLAEDFADGHIDGRNKIGSVVYALDGHPLPPNVLRQRFAQAARRFLKTPPSEAKDWGNCSSIGETAILDILHCVSNGSNLQTGTPGEALDVEPPRLKFITPAAGAYLAAAQDLVCEASDISGVASLRGSLWRDEQQLSEALGKATVGTGATTTRRLTAPLRITNTTTGPVEFRCEATDVWGNTVTASQPLHINRGAIAPQITVSAENLNELAASVNVTCACSEDPYSHRCELTSPRAEEAASLSDSGDRWASYTWNTHDVLDGQHVLTCSSWSKGIDAPVTQSLGTRVKNHEPGRASGKVFLDTLVEHVSVTAYAYQNGVRGAAELGTDEAADGAFSLPITNEYRGPVLLVAERSRNTAVEQPEAKFHNVPLDDDMSLGGGSLHLLLDHYEPGQTFTGLSINVATTMAEGLSTALWRQGIDSPATFYDAAQAGHRLVAQYLSPTRPFDPRRTQVANLGISASSNDDELMLGLFHVGLSRLAADYSLQKCHRRSCITVADILEGMRRDLEDGRLDGQDRRKARIRLGFGAQMGEDFFRIELARAIRRWLDRVPFADKSEPAINASELTPRAFVPRLQGLAAHDSRLFGNRPGTQYDDEGPTLNVQLFDVDGQRFELGSAPLGRVKFRVVVEGHDDTGVAWIHAALNGRSLDNVQAARPEHAEFWVDTAVLADGELELVIESQDGQGNPSTPHYLHAVVDRVAPTLTLDVNEIWLSSGQHRIGGVASKSQVALQVIEGDSLLFEASTPPQGDRTFSLPVNVSCPAHHTLTIRARDAAGNVGEAKQIVHCDDNAPSLQVTPLSFLTDAIAGADTTHVPVHEPLGAEIPLHTRLAAAPVVKKFWHRLDYLPPELDELQNALPTLYFDVSDFVRSTVGSPFSALRLSYQYSFFGQGHVRTRDWSPITDCDADGRCKLVFSYQTMLPQEILREAVDTQRRMNFIARSTPNDLHSVLIRAVDEAGNERLVEWAFRLDLYSGDINVSCGFHSLVQEARIKGGWPVTLCSLPETPMLVTDLRLDAPTTASSLTPLGGSHEFEIPTVSLYWRPLHANKG